MEDLNLKLLSRTDLVFEQLLRDILTDFYFPAQVKTGQNFQSCLGTGEQFPTQL